MWTATLIIPISEGVVKVTKFLYAMELVPPKDLGSTVYPAIFVCTENTIPSIFH